MFDLKLVLDIKLFFVDYLYKEKYMIIVYLEYVNIIVENLDELVSLFCMLFGWKVWWSGGVKNDGYMVYVGNDKDYLVFYRFKIINDIESDYKIFVNINYIGIVVFNLDEIEQQVLVFNFNIFNYGDYELGRCFYFMVQ